MRLLILLLLIIILVVLVFFLGLQVIALGDFVKSGFSIPFALSFDFARYKEYPEFFQLIVFILFVLIISFIYDRVFRESPNTKKRWLTNEERARVSKLASRFEAKKGTQRLEFDSEGANLQNDTIRGFFDVTFDGIKKSWNKFVTFVRLPDVYKMNTLKNWSIDGEITNRRGGPPVITSRNAIWVDAEDTHTLVVGTTRSGKTFSIVNILIQSLRMAGESTIVMDVKGELYKTHAQSFIDAGYDVKRVDFINPKKSVRWNPLGIIIKKYREAYERYQQKVNSPDITDVVQSMAVKQIIFNKLKEKLEREPDNQMLLAQKKEIQSELDELLNNTKIPKPDYSEAQELISDIARRLCYEEDARDPFWPSSATTLLEGYINFLLEERVRDKDGKLVPLPAEMINMRSVKSLHDRGKTRIDPKRYNGCSTVLEYYINTYRNADDMSAMKLKGYVTSPDNTKGSTAAVMDDDINLFQLNENISAMTSVSDFELSQLGERKTAVFISIHDEKGTYHKLPSILISQIYEELIKTARNEKSLRLKVPVYVVWDEFANGAKWDNVVNALTAGLSRGVRFCLVLQDYNQLDTKYHEKAGTIKSNCQNLYYLLAGEVKTLEEISKACGTKKVWDSNKRDKIDVPVLSVDALQKLSMGEAVIIRQRKNPVKTRLKGFYDYGFTLPKTVEPDEHELPYPSIFNIEQALKDRMEQDPPRNTQRVMPPRNGGGGTFKERDDNPKSTRRATVKSQREAQARESRTEAYNAFVRGELPGMHG